MTTNGDHTSIFDTTIPNQTKPRSFTTSNFTIETCKLPILKAGPIDQLTTKIGIQIPEMIFGDNYVSITHQPSRFSIRFTASGALDSVDKTGEKRLKVAYSQAWYESRENAHDFQELEEVKPFDWSYTPQEYRGEVSGVRLQESQSEIPLALLKRPDPILFFDDVMLYEDELADNGIAMFSVKVRVMPARMLLLARFFMRLDGVLLRVRDTRVYIDFGQKLVIREYIEKAEEYESIRLKLSEKRVDVSAAMRDAALMAEMLPLRRREIDEARLPD